MSGEQEELYSYDPTALADYESQYQQSPQAVGVGGRLNTPPHPASPRVSISILPPGPTVGVGTNMNLITSQKRKATCQTTHHGRKRTRRVPHQSTPSSPSNGGSQRSSSASGSDSGSRASGGSGRGSGGCRRGSGVGGGDSGGDDDDDEDDEVR